MEQKSLSEIYHQETKYAESLMGKFQHQIEWNRQPSPYKEYCSEKKVDLLPYLPFKNNPFTGKPLQSKEDSGYPFGKLEIARLLYFTNGATGVLQYVNGQTTLLRSAPTAGGLYPTEIYLAIRNLSSFENGIYNFQVRDHSLILVWEGDFWNEFEQYCLRHEAVSVSNLLMICTAVYQRSAWRYQERAYRRILLDTGHIIGNMVAYAQEEGFTPVPIGSFYDRPLTQLLFLDEATEGPLVITALPQTSKINPRTLQNSVASPIPANGETNEKGQTLQLKLHYSSFMVPEQDVPPVPSPISLHPIFVQSKYPVRESLVLPSVAMDWEHGTGQTILTRRSTRAYTGEALPREDLAAILEYGYAPLHTSPLPLLDADSLETYLVIQNVTGLRAGVYHYQPIPHELHLLLEGDFIQKTWHFCLGQELARDAAALLIHTAHLKEALGKHGNRAYRYLHLDAGHLGERVNLAAIRLGLGVSGIGGFYDDEVNALLGLTLEQIVVYITTLGQPQR